MTIFYLHIPKTGGQTLATRLASAFPIGRSDILGPDLAFPQGAESLRRMIPKMDFIERHVSGPVLRGVFGLDILVTVREPVAQIVSNYLHIRREPASPLYRPANALSAAEFLAKFGDFLGNHQTRYLLSAFFDFGVDPDALRTWSERIFGVLDRIRWVIPTEAIDEFVTLWALDGRKEVPGSEITINVASRKSGDEALSDLVRQMPDLYSCDLLLWHAARDRFTAYRREVLRAVLPFDAPDNTSRAYAAGSSGIWLRDGWYPPHVGAEHGLTWWAGPSRYSEITYSRAESERYVSFLVVVVCGIRYSDIWALGPDRKKRLPVKSTKRQDSFWEFRVDLDGLPLRGTVYLWVPEVWAPIMVSASDTDARRKSFAACAWRLVDATPFETDQSPLPDGELLGSDSGDAAPSKVEPQDRPVSSEIQAEAVSNEMKD